MAAQTESQDLQQIRSPKTLRKNAHRSCKSTSSRPIRIRILLVGSEKTGKSCLIKRYCEKRFVTKYLQTIGIDYGATKIYLDKREVNVHIFDTSGNPLFRDIRNEFYLDAHGILFVYDVTRRETFYNLSKWLHEIRLEILQRGSGEDIIGKNPTKTVIVCANKIDAVHGGDSDSIVEDTEAKLWSELHGFPYCETSAATGQGVGEMFQTFFTQIVRQQLDNAGSGTFPRTPASARRVQLAQNLSSTTLTRNSMKNDLTGLSSMPSPEQSAVMKILKSGQYEQLFPIGSNRDEINRMYRKLAILLHPDKTSLSGADEAFKILCVARRKMLAVASF